MPDDWKPRQGQKIEAMYAWVATEADGGEGIISMTFQSLGTVPLVGADMGRMESLREHAIRIAKQAKVPLSLKRFGHVEILEEHEP